MRSSRALLVGLVVLLIAALGVLATLQYRWIDRISEAEREQMRANLDFSARRFAHDLGSEIETLFVAFFRPEGGDAWERYDEWRRRADDPALIESIHQLHFEEGAWEVREIDLETGEAREVAWPKSLERVQRLLARIDGSDPRGIRWPPPFLEEIPAILVAQRPGPPGEGPRFDERPRFAFREPAMPIVVTLSRNHLATSLLPRLVERHFSSRGADEYDIAVMIGDEILYRSDASWPNGHEAADIELALPLDPRGGGRPRFERFRPPQEPNLPQQWRLLVRRHAGGLEAPVAAARRRNLALSFGILLLLGATALALVGLLRRADRLRTQQAEFVAAITHELNTPVAALRAAGENMKDGIVTEREKIVRYGETIVKESSRLAEMIGQVLDFAGMRARPIRRSNDPIDIASIIDDALSQTRVATGADSIAFDVSVEPELPAVSGDREALTRAVQNLVANAVRHGGAGEWIGVRARREREGVAITVEDRGPGIDPADASQLFEPFYRGIKSDRIRGAGLGLAIVREVARAHGGSVDYQRDRATGAAFTIHLPAGNS